MTKKRGNNEGSIYFHKPSKKWCAQVSLEGRRLTHYANTQRECREWIKETLAKIDSGLTYRGASLTIADYLKEWLEIVKPTLRPKTWMQYSQVCNQHIIPHLGRNRLKDLRTDHIQLLYSSNLKEGKSVRTVRLMHSIFRRALNHALEWGLLGRNPIHGAKPPIQKKKEMKFLNVNQVRALLGTVENTRYEALYHLAVTTGMRQGELLGLKFQDVNYKQKSIRVQRQLQRITGQGLVFSEPKTRNAKRLISLGDNALGKIISQKDIIDKERLFAGNRWQDFDLIFPSIIGTPHEPRNLYRHFIKILMQAGLPKIRFHDLRHTAASLMLQRNIHPKVVQERLGHSSISLTIDIYSHAMPSMQEAIANELDRFLG
ncbi:MAG: site-specific integrase [Chloroflexi bacterium]|nr:MAG: site-specific integrase [Chloroflexota bacterium]MBL1197175.1 site-specific integrase [Chloroflexota bacterium]NOH14469.1 site-specific integrase [Chloroflexota bacterium]